MSERQPYHCLCGKWTGGNPDDKCRDCKRKEQAEVLGMLREYFGEPVVPLSVVCDALTAWKDAIIKGVTDTPPTDPSYNPQQGSQYAEHLHQMFIDIRKSGLLWRLLFMGQEVRTEKCVRHQGHMDTGLWALGADFNDPESGICCDGSGWLETDLASRDRRVAAVYEWQLKNEVPRDKP